MEYRRYAYTRTGNYSIEVSNGYLALGLGFDIGGGDSNDNLQLALYLGFVSIWLTYGAKWVRNIAKGISKLRGHKYTQEFGSEIKLQRGGVFSLSIGGDHMGDDAVLRYYADIPGKLKGRAKHETYIEQRGETTVVMPEKKYLATYEVELHVTKYPRWITREHRTIHIEIPEGIPHEGKGENSYDCGMDYTYGASSEWKGSIREATNAIAISILRDRQRHSALDQYLNVPSGLPATQEPIPQGQTASVQSSV